MLGDMTMNEEISPLPPMPAGPPAAPAGGQRWWARPAVAGIAGLVLGAGAVGTAWAVQSAGGSEAPAAFTLTGAMVLTGDHIPAGDADGSCEGTQGYDDITEGASVSVYSASGAVVATGSLGAGIEDGTSCRFLVRVAEVPKGEKFYQVEVSHRGKITVSAKEAEDGGFAASLG